ncbi:pentatricopeptide repeat-containing protein At1g06270 [Ricinus communis]|uniref:Pentatricopeptide repeat-containing protein, putative n=1 Tax=Ricinus communis TaxID=3988 RepID=B9SGM9_RICCO|nr:pentatricopeptide repeat-containing protein At1g06270 [Ricinus communis]XP_015578413.1 pentatricopeptide repeat-containing protein At1g06270 [Ricinus communis]XP_025014194.1 pentatricopeptide repeat-containing protein At1g06270 [Ricinus communis]EEF37275.1 pentatricopeptide repeat-containing protein, putative [Ricinus communis]|eukprot:XP_002525148.1 pentatricopeptide repeat-containing protein At1g06270 [Ricinus communis]
MATTCLTIFFYVGTFDLSKMIVRAAIKLHQIAFNFSLCRSISSLERSIKAAIETESYQEIPDLLISSKIQSLHNPNPFSFLSTFPLNQRTHIIDKILQSFITIRPHSRLKLVYSCLLSHTLQSPNPLPLALAILQRGFRSGFMPEPQIRLFLTSAWLNTRVQLHTVAGILLEMESIGYYPDCGICNYIIYSLCSVDQLPEAVKVLKGMSGAGCVPDLECYDTVIGSMSKARKTVDAVEIMKEMVVKVGLNPRQGTMMKLAAALRANREILIAVELIEFLEREGCVVGFGCYQLVLEGCLERKEYILAAKVVMRMTDKGFIPYIKVRQKVVEGLIDADAWNIACTVRQRFAELSS